MITIPSNLISAIASESAVLFLGAGASIGARHPNGASVPNGQDLKTALSNRFLEGKLQDKTLQHVADVAINESDLNTVQSFIYEIFEPFEPADHHLIIPRFSWHAIVTTNYDLIVEKAYQQAGDTKQELAVFTKDGQSIDQKLKKMINGIRYIKLHGSIDCIDDRDIPLTLSAEQYSRHSKHRNRLFHHLQNYGHEFPIIFCGYSIDDSHIQDILFDLSDAGVNRPRYYYVRPDLDDFEVRYWARHRITCIQATFEDFLVRLESTLPAHERSLPSSFGPATDSVRGSYKIYGAPESAELKLFLGADVEHVRPGMATNTPDPKLFYIGADPGWGPIESELDVRRRITDTIIVDTILEDERDRQRVVDLHVIKGPAGHGKTTVLRRVAWDSAQNFEKVCLFVNELGNIRTDALKELCHLIQDRVYLFIDRAALHVDEIVNAISALSNAKAPVSIVTAERDNEWNVRCGQLDAHVAQEYHVRNLSETEIHALIHKLDEHSSLGRLAGYSFEDQVREFHERAERQLLVALHEATLGKSFEEIVRDEYDRIMPTEAQTLYLDVCTLNRLGVPVRAGLVARVSGIRFEDFRQRFLKPLEYVVHSYYDRYAGDRMYKARHQHIADLVFQLVLADQGSRYDQLMRIVDGMNIDYSSDCEAFRSLIRGRHIADIFSSQDVARKFYERAQRIVGDDPHLLQQRAVFEMRHPGGSLRVAERWATSALEILPNDRTIIHTLANVKRRQANDASNPLLRDKLRRSSKSLVRSSRGFESHSEYGFHTALLVSIDQLRDELSSDEGARLDRLEEKTVVDLISEIEELIHAGQQQFPDNELLLMAEVDFRDLLDDGRAVEALRSAFDRNPRSEWLAVRLGRRLEEEEEYAEARRVLQSCLRENPDSKAANFALAKLFLRRGTRDERGRVIHLLRRSFMHGDTQFDARYWYARELYLRGSVGEAKSIFNELGKAPLAPAVRNKLRGFVYDDDDNRKVYRATVTRKEETYFIASAIGFPTGVFCHASSVEESVWRSVEIGGAVRLTIGFSMRGPAGHLVEVG